jgi:exodeoxyribonuclease VII large subunit
MYSLAAESRQRLDYLEESLARAEMERLKLLRSRLEMASAGLAAVGPQATLSRGYAIAKSPRGLILRAEDAKAGDVVELILAEGMLICQVLDIKNQK